MDNKKNLIIIYKIHKKLLNDTTKFINDIKSLKNPELEKSYYNTIYYINKFNKPIDNDDNYFIKFIQKNKKLQIKFIQILRLFLKLFNKMKEHTIIKIFKKINIIPFKILLRKRIRNYDYFTELINIYISIYKKIRYFISNLFISTSLFFKVPTIKYKHYYNNFNNVKKNNCEINNCLEQNNKELENIYNNFINAKKLLKEATGKNKNKAIQIFISSDAFKNYYKCFYNNCNKIFLSYLRSKLNYYYSIESLRAPIYTYRYKKEFERVKKVFKYSTIKTYDDFLIAVGEYWNFVVKINIYI